MPSKKNIFDKSGGIKKFMTRRYLFGLAIIAFIFISAYTVMNIMIVFGESNASIINVSGRQRMLSQRISMLSSELIITKPPILYGKAKGQLVDAIELMEKSHRGLLEGSKNMNLPDTISESIKLMYFAKPMNADERVTKYLTSARRLANTPLETLKSDNPDYQFVISQATPLLKSLNEIVAQYEKEANKDVLLLHRIETLILAIALITLIAEIFLIFRPTVVRVVRTQKELEKADKIKSEFLASISHEIRTPVNGIIGTTEVLLNADKPLKNQKDYLHNILISAENLMDLLNDVLDFSNMEVKSLTLIEYPFSIKRSIESTVRLLRGKASEKNLKIINKLDPKMPEYFIGDDIRIRQIMHNLIDNAIKFTSKGTIEIAVKEIKSSKNTSTIEVSVNDTGIGLSTEQQSIIFNKFMQADRTTTRKYGGTGLGLTICKELVEMMGGAIEIESQQGKGSTFKFTLTFQKSDKAAASKVSDSEKINHNKKLNILMAEDNRINAEFTREALNDLGCEVLIAHNGSIAIDLFKNSGNIDLVFMDIDMPVMDGYEATDRILKLEKKQQNKHTPIIALTANAMEGDREKCLNAGMDDYLSKPVKQKDLAKILDKWVDDNETI